MNKKKIKKNIPYLFVFLALVAIVSYRVWEQERRSEQAANAPQEQNMSEEEKARISVSHLYESPKDSVANDNKGEGDYIKAGAFTTAEDGSITYTPSEGIAEGKSKQNVNLIFDFDKLPATPEKAEADIGRTVKEWRKNDYKVYSVVIRYINPTIDTDALDQLTARLHQRLKLRVGAYVQRKWLEDNPDKTPTALANISKNTQNFVYDEREIRQKGQSLGSAIRDLDKYKLGYVVIVDEKPDLLALRKEVQDTSTFGGLIIRGAAK